MCRSSGPSDYAVLDSQVSYWTKNTKFTQCIKYSIKILKKGKKATLASLIYLFASLLGNIILFWSTINFRACFPAKSTIYNTTAVTHSIIFSKATINCSRTADQTRQTFCRGAHVSAKCELCALMFKRNKKTQCLTMAIFLLSLSSLSPSSLLTLPLQIFINHPVTSKMLQPHTREWSANSKKWKRINNAHKTDTSQPAKI